MSSCSGRGLLTCCRVRNRFELKSGAEDGLVDNVKERWLRLLRGLSRVCCERPSWHISFEDITGRLRDNRKCRSEFFTHHAHVSS